MSLTTSLTNLQSNPKFCTAIKKYQTFAGEIAKKMGIEGRVVIAADQAFNYVSVIHQKRENRFRIEIHVGLDCLIDPNDVPQEFLISSMDDPRIHNREFVNKLVDWVLKYFKTGKRSDKISESEKFELIYFIFVIKNPELFEKNKKFIILRELALTLLKHQEVARKDAMLAVIKMLTLSAAAGLTAAYFFSTQNPLFLTGVFKTGSSVVAGLGAAYATIKWTTGFYDSILLNKLRQTEIEADTMAVKILQDAEGAIYALTLREIWMKKMQSDFSKNLRAADDMYPLFTERMKNLKKKQSDIS